MGKVFFGQVGRIKPEKKDVYVDLHKNAWPEILKAISSCNIKNYSIFIRDNVVFSYFEYVGEDYEADKKKLAGYNICKKWWEITDPCFVKYDDHSENKDFENMERIFYLE